VCNRPCQSYGAISTNCSMGQGIEQAHDTGYGGSGFKLNEQDDEA
jgi:hypothetical protein